LALSTAAADTASAWRSTLAITSVGSMYPAGGSQNKQRLVTPITVDDQAIGSVEPLNAYNTCAVHGGVDGKRALCVEEHDRVLCAAGGGGGDDVGEAPGERVHALLAPVHGHHDAAPGSGCRSRRRCHAASELSRSGGTAE
jgi:hypothetical protein